MVHTNSMFTLAFSVHVTDVEHKRGGASPDACAATNVSYCCHVQQAQFLLLGMRCQDVSHFPAQVNPHPWIY